MQYMYVTMTGSYVHNNNMLYFKKKKKKKSIDVGIMFLTCCYLTTQRYKQFSYKPIPHDLKNSHQSLVINDRKWLNLC